MGYFSVALNAMIPLFVEILVGVIARRAKLVSEEDRARLNKIFYHTLLPFLTFSNIYFNRMTVSEALSPMLFCTGALLVVTLLSAATVSAFEKCSAQRGVMVQAILRSNVVIMALPLLQSMYPDANMGVVTVVCTAHVVTINIVSVIVLEAYRGNHVSFPDIVVSLLKNPLIIGCMASFLLKLLDIELPSTLGEPIKAMGSAAGVVMLFILGTFFRFDGIKSARKNLFISVCGRLLIVPAFVLPAAVACGFRGYLLALILCIFATPTAVNSVSLVKEFGGDAELAANIVVLTTALSCVTMCILITILRALQLI